MRFLHLTTFYPPWNFGGDGIFVQQLAQTQVQDGHEVEVVHCLDAYKTLAKPNVQPTSSASDGVVVHSLKSSCGALSPIVTHQSGYPAFKSNQIHEVLRRGFDVVHFHNASLLGPKVFELVPKSAQTITLHTSHEFWLVCPTHTLWKNDSEVCEKKACISCTIRYRRPPQFWRYTRMLERACMHVDRFLAPSEFVVKTLKTRGFRHEIEYLPNFVSLDSLRSPMDSGFGAEVSGGETWSEVKDYVLYAGRLELIKGVDFAIDAWKSINDVDLLIAGTGRQEAELKKKARSNPRVKFLGKVPREELGRLYQRAMASIVPSVGYENCPLACLESFALGTPVLGFDQAGVKELVEKSNGGLLYLSEQQLRDAVELLKRDTNLRNRLALNGEAAWREHWTPRAHLDRYYEIIENTQFSKRKR